VNLFKRFIQLAFEFMVMIQPGKYKTVHSSAALLFPLMGTFLQLHTPFRHPDFTKSLSPDGKECFAMALGRIVTEPSTTRPDVAMIKILSPGSWPYAEMGWSSSVIVNEPCFGISYPESLAQRQPMVRYGAILNTMNQWGFLESSCIMETGDSGGPLFDYLGRIIGMHSRIDAPEAANYEVPVNLYRRYWTALNTAQNYSELPTRADEVKTDPVAANLIVLSNLKRSNDDMEWIKNVASNVVLITSTIDDTLQNIDGTVFSLKGMETKNPTNKTFIVSKSSMVGSNPYITLGQGKKAKAQIVNRDISNDLVLLSIAKSSNTAIEVSSFDTAGIDINDLGRNLISVLPEGFSKTSVIGSFVFDLPARFSSGYFGSTATFKDGKTVLLRVQNASPAATAGFLSGDIILSINGISLNRKSDFSSQLMKYWPGEQIAFQCSRGDSSFSKVVELHVRPQLRNNHPMEKFEGGKSIRRDGFSKAFVHDARIRSCECGSPVFESDGRFVGINIARFSHTSTVVLPAGIIYKFLKNVLEI